jgi:hypothetical protein
MEAKVLYPCTAEGRCPGFAEIQVRLPTAHEDPAVSSSSFSVPLLHYNQGMMHQGDRARGSVLDVIKGEALPGEVHVWPGKLEQFPSSGSRTHGQDNEGQEMGHSAVLTGCQ